MNMISFKQSQSSVRLPGSSVSVRVKVYDTPSFDGKISGTPHVHLLCTEMYFVLAGSGTVEIIDKDGFSQIELLPYSTLIFQPGTIHRLINPNKNLELLVIEQNGLPEFGDNIVCFKDYWLQNEEFFVQAMKVDSVDNALKRRDRGVEGFLEIQSAFASSQQLGQKKLKKFYELATERTSHLHHKWENLIANGALTEARNSIQQLNNLTNNDISHLLETKQHLVHADKYTQQGCCGYLNRYFDKTIFMLEGLKQV